MNHVIFPDHHIDRTNGFTMTTLAMMVVTTTPVEVTVEPIMI